MVLGLGLRLTNTALQARRDAQRREAQRLNKGVKTGQVRLERRTGMAYGSHCKKGGAGGSGTWGALNRYDDMDDDWEEVEQVRHLPESTESSTGATGADSVEYTTA
jgi:hypothetical protein